MIFPCFFFVPNFESARVFGGIFSRLPMILSNSFLSTSAIMV
jgi:hypothetical protein